MSDDLYRAKLEKALKEKYGEDILDSPEVDAEFKTEFIKQEQELYDKEISNNKENTFENRNGYLLNKRLIKKEIANCPYCDRYKLHFTLQDDYCLKKWGCCNICHDRYISGKEKKWLEGWRPKNDNK
jgi:hypothetical protein